MDIIVDLDDRVLRDMEEHVRERVSAVVRKTAFDLEGKAKQKAPVDTSFLRNSIFTVTDQGSTVVEAQTKASEKLTAKNKQRRRKKLTEVERNFSETAGDTKIKGIEAAVVVGAEYGPFVEVDHPFLTPARDEVEPTFQKAIHRVLEGGKGEGRQ